MSDSSKPKEKQVAYLVYPFEVDELADAEHVLAMLERLHYLGYAVILSPVYLKSTGYFTFDLQISYTLIKKCDVMVLCYEERMTQLMLKELMKGREYGKPVVRIPRKAD